MAIRSSTCRSCGAAVVWLPTTQARRMIINADTVRPDDTVFDPKAGHIAHWASCPDRQLWQGKTRR